MTFVIMGPQGSGKGTQARLISEEFGIRCVSIGDLLRKEVEQGSEIGKIVEGYMRKGLLVPLEINNALVKKVIDENEHVLIDGYPRSVEQAEFLLSITNIDAVIVIDISEQESFRRLSNRVVCTANNKIFVNGNISREDEEECVALGGKIVRRSDDDPVAIKKRLDIYKSKTSLVVPFFKKKGIFVVEVDGELPVDTIFRGIKEKISFLF